MATSVLRAGSKKLHGKQKFYAVARCLTTTTTTTTNPVNNNKNNNNNSESTLAILKPDLLANPQTISTILNEIEQAGIEVVQKKSIQWSQEEAKQFYIEHKERFFYQRLVGYMTSGPMIVMELRGPGVIGKWREMVGKTHPVRMRVLDNGCLRARFGLTDTRNGFHGSDSYASAIRELQYVFNRKKKGKN